MIVDSGMAATTVFCAVWHRDPERWDLLRSHQECLQAQTAKVAAVYVFDGGDEAPEWLQGTIVEASSPLTIYQAWNVATQAASTDWVMNLNLDDRLAPWAVALLEAALIANKVDLVGADWRISPSREDVELHAAAPVVATELPFDPSWPPRTSGGRLGSGTGDRGTLGPATIWARSLHEKAPYPWQFTDGSPIRVIGDLVWWRLSVEHLGARLLRLPVIIGNYHSHPADQAEFRVDGAEEQGKLEQGVEVSNVPLAPGEFRIRRQGEGRPSA